MSAPSSPACADRLAPSPGRELLQGVEQQQQPCTEPSTPSAAPADLAQALHWHSLQQQQQPLLQQGQTHHVTSNSPRNQFPAQAPSTQSLQPALLQQLLDSSEDAAQADDAAASSAGQLTAAVQDGAEGNSVSPFSPSSADLLQQLDELHRQVAVLTRHVRADADARSEGSQLAGLGAAQTSAQRLALRSAHQSYSQGATVASSQHSPVPAGSSAHLADSILFNRVGSSSSLASSSFDSGGISARPAQAVSTRDAAARPSAGSRLSTGWPAQPTGDSEAYDMPHSIPDLPPDSHDSNSRYGLMRWEEQLPQLAHRLLAEGAQPEPAEQSHAGLRPLSLHQPASQPTPQQANRTVGDAASAGSMASHGVLQPLRGALGGLQAPIRPGDAAWADTLAEARLAPVLAVLRRTTDVLAQANAPMQHSDQQASFDGSQMPSAPLGAAAPAAIYREPTLNPAGTAAPGPAAYQQHQQVQARPSAEAQHSFGMIPQAAPPMPGAIMQAVQEATQPAFTASAGRDVPSAQAPGINPAAGHAGVQLQAGTSGMASAAGPAGFPPLAPSASHLPAAPSMAGLQHPGLWPAAAAAASTGAGMPGMPGMPFSHLGQFPGALLAEQQLDYLLRLRQVQMLQQHMQAAAVQGGVHGPGLQVAALHGQPAAVWGMPAYPDLLQPAMQQQAAGGQAGAAAIAATPPAGVAAAVGNGPPVPTQWTPPVDFGSPVAARSSSTSAPAAQALSPFAAAASCSSTADDAWLTRWMPLSRRSTSHDASAQAPQPRAASWAVEQSEAAAGTMTCAVQASASPPAAPSTFMQLVLYPVARPLAAAAAGGSLMLQALWCAGGTAASASAWSAQSAAMACVRLSQYQLLVLLCSLTAVATAAQAAGCAAAAAADTSRTILQLADRETRLFARAAAVVAYTDMKQLCRQLATQPLLLMQGAAPAQAALQEDQVGTTAARGDPRGAVSTQSRRSSIETSSAADGTGRSLSRGLSGLLGGLFAAAAGQHSRSHLGSTHSTPRPSFSASRRCSATGGPLQLDGYPATAGSGSSACSRFSSQELTVGTGSGNGGGALAAGRAGFRSLAASGGVWGVSAATLVLYDSLAVVSGLWAGMWFRLWLLLMLQGPLASARIWLQAVRTACMVSAAATLATTRTSMQAAWTLSHLSLAVLGSAAAKSAAGGASAQHSEASKASAGSVGPIRMWSRFAGVFPAALIAALQWICQQAARPWGSALQYLGAAVTAAVPGSGAVGQRMSRWYATAASAVSVLAAATSETLLWFGTVRKAAGLFSKSGLKAVASKGLQLAGFLVTWVLSMWLGLAERLAVPVVEFVLRDVSPVGRAAVYGSARMIKGLVVEASRQSGLLACHLFEAWKLHD